MTDQEIVRARYPGAACVRGHKLMHVYATLPPPPFDLSAIHLGSGVTADLAWGHAANTVEHENEGGEL